MKNIFLLLIIFISPALQAHNHNSVKSVLPNCSSLEKEYPGLPGVRRMSETCIGDFLEYSTSHYRQARKAEARYLVDGLISLIEDGPLYAVIKRNPALLSLAQFLAICRPLEGSLSFNGLYCKYEIKL